MTSSAPYPYIISLRNESARYVNIIGFLLTAGSSILFLREMILRNQIIVPYLAGILFIAGLILWSWWRSRKPSEDGEVREIYYSKALLIAGLVWTKMPYMPWLVIIFVLLAFLEYQAKLSPEIGFSTEHIVFNGLFKKRYSWEEIDNVVLRDGILTVDFKNNKLVQKEIDSGENEASEEEFNEWVNNRLIR